MTKSLSVSSIQPLAGYILIKPTQAETKTKSGIYLPENEGKIEQYGEVFAIGKSIFIEGKEIVSPVKEGDKVIFKNLKYDEVNKIEINELELHFFKFEDILAVIK